MTFGLVAFASYHIYCFCINLYLWYVYWFHFSAIFHSVTGYMMIMNYE